jgi:hypothetical protein
LYTVIRTLKAGKISEGDAVERLERSRHWVWTALDPVSKLLLAIEAGPRTVEMAQRVVQRVGQLFASGCVPRLSHKNFTRLSNASNLLGQSAKSSSAS